LAAIRFVDEVCAWVATFGEEGSVSGEVVDVGKAEVAWLVASHHWLRPSLDRD
jgi:hypothetical protein